MRRFYRATLKPSDVFTVASERELLVNEFRILSMKSENRLKSFSHFIFILATWSLSVYVLEYKNISSSHLRHLQLTEAREDDLLNAGEFTRRA